MYAFKYHRPTTVRQAANLLTKFSEAKLLAGGHSLIPFGRIHPASRSRVAAKYGILKIVPNYPSLGQWVQAFKTTTGQTLDRVQLRCH